MRELPFLLRLLDDESPVVRDKVTARLRELGEGVRVEIEAQKWPLSTGQKEILDEIFAADPTEVLLDNWDFLQLISDEEIYLETALLALSRWQSGTTSVQRAEEKLDGLSKEFLELEPFPDSVALARFLFQHCGLHGASTDDYYNARNSDLAQVLDSRAGLPITLACIFILVGKRVGLPIEGCAFPGHFLARDRRKRLFFDPFNGGRILSGPEVSTLEKAAPEEMNSRANSREIVGRVLRNLSVAFHHEGLTEKSGLMLTLLRAIESD